LLMSAAHCLAWVSAACRGSHKSTGIIWEGEGRHDVVRRGSLWRLEVAGTAGFNGDRVRRGWICRRLCAMMAGMAGFDGNAAWKWGVARDREEGVKRKIGGRLRSGAFLLCDRQPVGALYLQHQVQILG
jgi:hypothetical protein